MAALPDTRMPSRGAAPGPPAQFGLDGSAPRLLGVAFLLVIATSLVSGLLIAAGVGSDSSIIGTGSASQLLVDTSKNLTTVRIGVVGDLLTSAGIIALAALLYIVLRGQSRVLAQRVEKPSRDPEIRQILPSIGPQWEG